MQPGFFELGLQGLLRGLAESEQRLDLSPSPRRCRRAWWNWRGRIPNLLRRFVNVHLNQAARELMLAQASDWAFIMKTGTMVEYAVNRTHVHVLNFNHLYEQIKGDTIDETWLVELERRHNLFPNLDYRMYT